MRRQLTDRPSLAPPLHISARHRRRLLTERPFLAPPNNTAHRRLFWRAAASRFPGQVVVGIDAKDGDVALEGWLEGSGIAAPDLAKQYEDAGVAAIVYTDIARDGMLEGPNIPATVALAEAVSIPVIVSGGVSCTDDIVEASRHVSSGIAGVIVGKALYSGAVDLDEALEAVRKAAGEGA